jgi:high-affinity Fe2+/Pb2+ permease
MLLISTAITGTKIIAGIVVLAVIAVGAFFWMRSRSAA